MRDIPKLEPITTRVQQFTDPELKDSVHLDNAASERIDQISATPHTQGRLAVFRHYDICAADVSEAICSTGTLDGDLSDEELARARGNARRLVACWNRLLPFTTEQIEQGIDLVAMKKEQDALIDKER